jgi:hypothetical protein
MTTTTNNNNLAELAFKGNLTVEQVRAADFDKLLNDEDCFVSSLFWASKYCHFEVVKAILDRGVPVNQLTGYGVCVQ